LDAVLLVCGASPIASSQPKNASCFTCDLRPNLSRNCAVPGIELIEQTPQLQPGKVLARSRIEKARYPSRAGHSPNLRQSLRVEGGRDAFHVEIILRVLLGRNLAPPRATGGTLGDQQIESVLGGECISGPTAVDMTWTRPRGR
jgi:hypothetical protein